ncbi:MAG: hypothetical protein CL678_03870 [Bdellovibrionaceae bacterium]|nr:hypothetical protein [Pseudobdellovibrionaceae bacterium]|tara:strand:+ start:4820 stop:5680 length:861 start_codon:yes stop_codon:yes gene_type:complete
MKKIIGLLIILIMSSCGKKAPPGYQWVTIGSVHSRPQTSLLNPTLLSFGKKEDELSVMAACPMNHFAVVVEDTQGIAPLEYIRVLPSPQVQYSFGTVFDGSVDAFSAEVLVQEGLHKKFGVTGTFYSNCNSQIASFPVGGMSPTVVDILPEGGLFVPINASVFTAGFSVDATPANVTVAGSDFAKVTVSWSPSVPATGNCSGYSGQVIKLRDVKGEFFVSTNGVTGQGFTGSENDFTFGPLFPGVLYSLTIENSIPGDSKSHLVKVDSSGSHTLTLDGTSSYPCTP